MRKRLTAKIYRSVSALRPEAYTARNSFLARATSTMVSRSGPCAIHHFRTAVSKLGFAVRLVLSSTLGFGVESRLRSPRHPVTHRRRRKCQLQAKVLDVTEQCRNVALASSSWKARAASTSKSTSTCSCPSQDHTARPKT